MIIDRYTKAVFTLIAISLFVISLNQWIAPTKAYAEWGMGSEKILHNEIAFELILFRWDTKGRSQKSIPFSIDVGEIKF